MPLANIFFGILKEKRITSAISPKKSPFPKKKNVIFKGVSARHFLKIESRVQNVVLSPLCCFFGRVVILLLFRVLLFLVPIVRDAAKRFFSGKRIRVAKFKNIFLLQTSGDTYSFCSRV